MLAAMSATGLDRAVYLDGLPQRRCAGEQAVGDLVPGAWTLRQVHLH